MIGLAQLGGPIACLGLALLLVAKTRRDRIAGLGFAAFGTGVLGVALAPHRPLEIFGGIFAALGIGLALALLFRRLPWLLPLLALACVPARVGVHVGGASTKLLLPLYVVVLGAAIKLAWDLLAGDPRVRELRAAAWPLAAFVGWTGVSLAWSKDLSEGAVEVLAFYVPFTLLAIAIARLPWSDLGLRLLYGEVLVMGVVFAVVGFYQYDTRDIFQNPKVINANAYTKFFRVNSVFWDPSVYGRFLVLAIAPSLVLIVFRQSLRVAVVAAAGVIVMWLGLLISFSQSSFAALLAVVICVAFLAWHWRALVAVGLTMVVLAGMLVAQPQIRRSVQHHTSSGLNQATSGRSDLVANGLRIAAHNPVLGVGVGGFKRAYADRVNLKGKDPKKAASHNTPVTVAAETGLVGLGLYAWLLTVLLLQAFRAPRSALRSIAGVGIVAIFVHSLFYNAFFEDPQAWGLLGLLAFASRVRARRVETDERRVVEQEAVPV